MDVGRTRHVSRITNPEESGSYDAGGGVGSHDVHSLHLHYDLTHIVGV